MATRKEKVIRKRPRAALGRASTGTCDGSPSPQAEAVGLVALLMHLRNAAGAGGSGL